MPVIGAVERNGNVVAQPSASVTAAELSAFLTRHLDNAALLMTDEFQGYRSMARKMRHSVIDHGAWYAEGMTHTNTIEGFWGLLKRAWYGSRHYYSRTHAAKYIREACYEYNQRRNPEAFGTFLRGCFA